MRPPYDVYKNALDAAERIDPVTVEPAVLASAFADLRGSYRLLLDDLETAAAMLRGPRRLASVEPEGD